MRYGLWLNYCIVVFIAGFITSLSGGGHFIRMNLIPNGNGNDNGWTQCYWY